MLQPEILVAHAPRLSPVTQLRSTLLQSSLSALKEHGHYDAWHEAVDPAYRAQIIDSVAPAWLPIAVGAAHYTACDALDLGQHELMAMGEFVGSRVQNTFLATVTKAAKTTGLTPWAAVPHISRVWARLFVGGSVQVRKLGPKDVEFEIKGLPLLRFGYFRHAFGALMRSGLTMFGARAAYVNLTRFQPATNDLTMTAAWA